MNFHWHINKNVFKRMAVMSGGVFLTLFFIISPAGAQTATDTAQNAAVSSSTLQAELAANDQQMAAINAQIATYEAEIQEAGADKKTLQTAINSLDLQRNKVQAQVSLTQTQIQTTQLQIQQLGGEITNTEQTIAADQTALGAYLQSLQKTETQPLLVQMLSSGGLIGSWDDLNQTLQIQNGIQNEMQTLKEQEGTLSTSKTASQQKQTSLTTQQQSLATQQQSLASTVQSKDQLLTETNSQEATYQKLLNSAEAELSSFSAFAQNAGGSKLVGNQTVCDSWGCYYNQRDSAWGSDSLDGTKYTLASDGCLVTSMAMMMTHYGYRNVTPITINSNPNNFAAYYPAYLLTTINVDGMTVARKTVTIDATLAAGTPVVVGINAYGGTHFIVLVSGSKGNYIMKDPYITNGNDISFTDHYSLKSIFAITKVVISS